MLRNYKHQAAVKIP